MSSNDQEKIKLEEKAISKILVADTDFESGAEASDVEDNFQEEEEEEDDDDNNKSQQTTGCNKWWITNLGTVSRKEHKYSSICRSSKRCEKKQGSTHQHTQLATVCVDVVF